MGLWDAPDLTDHDRGGTPGRLAYADEETVVITRMWRGWTRSDDADRYTQHYRSEVLTTLRQIPGFRGARLLRRTLGEETEFVSLTLFDDLDAIRSFAGPDYETAVVAGEARKVLIRFDEQVCHYETVFDSLTGAVRSQGLP
jgi:heme-degrading monooxygenase HmoA